MSRPTLYLTNSSSRNQHGPGDIWAAMAMPPAHIREHTCGQVGCHAAARHVYAVREGLMSPAAYRQSCVTAAAAQDLRPAYLVGRPWGRPLTLIHPGDTLVCTCARPDTGRRPAEQPWCHLEVWAPWLAAAGWEVCLYGRWLTAPPLEDAKALAQAQWADTGTAYSGAWEPRKPPPSRQGVLW